MTIVIFITAAGFIEVLASSPDRIGVRIRKKANNEKSRTIAMAGLDNLNCCFIYNVQINLLLNGWLLLYTAMSSYGLM